METPVTYECQEPSHRVHEAGGPDKLTVHEGQWAFCPFDARAGGHRWVATGGLTLTMLKQSAVLRAREVVKDPAP